MVEWAQISGLIDAFEGWMEEMISFLIRNKEYLND